MACVLVVEDEQNLRGIIAAILTGAGYEVIEACDGSEIGACLEGARPDLVLTDILMPEKEGIQTIIELRRQNPELRIIGMSGGGMVGADHYLDMAKVFGANQTLQKPFSKEKLLRVVAAVLAAPVA